jgi:N,N'-diacetyllegionaminate synthase
MKKIKLIAELGWNWCGDMDVAKRMINAAAEAGADIVKFQTWKVERLIPGPWDQDGRRQIYEKAELTHDKHIIMKEECDRAGVQFLTSVFCPKDLDFVRTLINEVKIPSPEASNNELVEKALEKFDHLYVSTGATTIKEWSRWSLNHKVTLMHCISSYPCDPVNFHIKKLGFIKDASLNNFGFSGHSPIIWDAIWAMSWGATVIEKHFTIDNDLPGRDNKFALLPDAFSKLREFADVVGLMETEHSIDGILKCEENYLKHQKGRWG